jgi:hypothetical protein
MESNAQGRRKVNEASRKQLAERFQSEEIDLVVQEAVRRALAEHKRKRNSVVIWREGRVVLLSPEQIPVQ